MSLGLDAIETILGPRVPPHLSETRK